MFLTNITYHILMLYIVFNCLCDSMYQCHDSIATDMVWQPALLLGAFQARERGQVTDDTPMLCVAQAPTWVANCPVIVSV